MRKAIAAILIALTVAFTLTGGALIFFSLNPQYKTAVLTQSTAGVSGYSLVISQLDNPKNIKNGDLIMTNTVDAKNTKVSKIERLTKLNKDTYTYTTAGNVAGTTSGWAYKTQTSIYHVFATIPLLGLFISILLNKALFILLVVIMAGLGAYYIFGLHSPAPKKVKIKNDNPYVNSTEILLSWFQTDPEPEKG